MTHRTFGMIKPDVSRTHKGRIIGIIEQEGLEIIGLQRRELSRANVDFLYADHLAKPWYPGLREFTLSGPCILMALEGSDAVGRYRRLMGATDSSVASIGTIRNRYGDRTDVKRNAVHGSDSPESAQRELRYFFPELF